MYRFTYRMPMATGKWIIATGITTRDNARMLIRWRRKNILAELKLKKERGVPHLAAVMFDSVRKSLSR